MQQVKAHRPQVFERFPNGKGRLGEREEEIEELLFCCFLFLLSKLGKKLNGMAGCSMSGLR